MANGPSGANLINALRGSIYAGVQERENAAGLWARIRTDLDLPATGRTGIALQTFNAIWHEAVSARNVTAEYDKVTAQADRLGRDVGINSKMVMVPTWARPIQERNAAPVFQINFQMTMTNEDGTTDSGWFSIYKRGALPPTINGMADLVAYEAEMLAGRYGKSLASTSSVQIMAI